MAHVDAGIGHMEHTITLGLSELRVPRLGLGAMTWGQPTGRARWTPAQLSYGPSDGAPEEKRALEVSIAAGVNLVDTAEMYSAERLAGNRGSAKARQPVSSNSVSPVSSRMANNSRGLYQGPSPTPGDSGAPKRTVRAATASPHGSGDEQRGRAPDRPDAPAKDPAREISQATHSAGDRRHDECRKKRPEREGRRTSQQVERRPRDAVGEREEDNQRMTPDEWNQSVHSFCDRPFPGLRRRTPLPIL